MCTDETSNHKCYVYMYVPHSCSVAMEKLDAMLDDAEAWQSQYRAINSDDVDAMKVPQCCETFVALTTSMTERYRPLASVARRSDFLDLQLEVFEEFHTRLAQVKNANLLHPLAPTFGAILNTCYYILEVLKEWANVPVSPLFCPLRSPYGILFITFRH